MCHVSLLLSWYWKFYIYEVYPAFYINVRTWLRVAVHHFKSDGNLDPEQTFARVKAYPIRLRRNRGSSIASKISVQKFKVIIVAANKKSIEAASC